MLLVYLAALAASPAAQHCEPVKLSVAGGTAIFIAKFANNSDGFRKTSANFAKAYAEACAEGLLRTPLIGAKARDRRNLFLLNAPNANVASIYKSGGRMLLEYAFLSGGKANVPGVEELHEAIFCAVRGASAKEQEESGRCLPD
jgi:hypothetical protein